MIRRCYDVNADSFKYYGGRGITVDPIWKIDFWRFVEDMGPKPEPKYSLDRIDCNKNYGPSNCKWSSPREQQKNRRPWSFINLTEAERLDIRLSTQSDAKLAKLYNVSRKTIYNIRRGLVKL